jgi:tetratricopeptide (TPR) repeat protein
MISKGHWPFGDISSLMKKVANRDVPTRYFQIHSQEKPKFIFHKLFKVAKFCLQKDPNDRPKSFQHVKCLLLEAINAESEIAKTDEKPLTFDPWETGKKAASLLRLGRCEEALELFDMILEEFPLGVQWEFDKALTLSKLGRDSEADTLYSKILARDPSDLGALVNKGLLHQKNGDLTQAAKLFSIALEHHPTDVDTLVNIGNLAYKKENYKAATRYYKRAIELDPRYVTGWYNLGLSYRALDMVDQSIQCFNNFLHYSDPLDSRRKNALLILDHFG